MMERYGSYWEGSFERLDRALAAFLSQRPSIARRTTMTEISPQDVTDRDVYITRAFDAPRDVVWKFWTEPELLSEWFGPTTTHVPVETVTVELRVGGRWELSMVDDETGQAYPVRGRITRCEPPEYLEITANAESSEGDLENIVLRVQFHDHGDKTRVTIHQGPFTDEQRDMTAAGWELSFVKLDTVFANRS
jgi:uncharacterized protein YndB with AHSA1/START domain